MLKRLMGAFTALILIGVLITGLLSMEIGKTYYFNSVEEKLISNARLIQRELESKLEEGSTPDYEKFSEEYGRITGERITIVSVDGTVLGDSEKRAGEMENHADRPEIEQALEKGFGRSTRRSSTLGKEMLYIAYPLRANDDTVGAIRVALTLNDINSIQTKIWHYIFLAIFAGISVAVVLGYRYLSQITKSVREMTEMATTIAGGKFDKRVQVKSDDEIGRLVSAFNNMAEKLNNTINELVNDKSKMEAILTSSVNGVIAVDNDVKTLIINPAAEKLLDIREKDFSGKYLYDIVRNSEMERVLRSVIESIKDRSFEFELTWPEERMIRVFSAPIRPKVKHGRTIGTLIIIQDVTDIRKLEKIRSDFVANVTHELRTPLTSIRGFIETLKEGAIEDVKKRNRFLDIIDIEAERLERLIEDILLLSEIESGKPYSLPVTDIDVKRVIEDEIVSILRKKAEEKDIRIKTIYHGDVPPLKMNVDRFKQMMINLIDNAIKYSRENDEVTVSAYGIEDAVVLKVRDTGIGIPKEHQERLFERFYRVDKGRSRKVGGTGLGLAIVKHIVLSVDGSIKVSSEPGVGTEFRIEIPLKRGE
ncbi:MAG: Phosphate regulon sensor protein PhoR (SphS) [Firmicutes bacterium]|nr:Phosphate regulon sensor protein PhoR (SphS) [Bacillota bacterium]